MYIDDLPVSGTVGVSADETKEGTESDPHFKPLSVYTHKSFTIQYNGRQVKNNNNNGEPSKSGINKFKGRLSLLAYNMRTQ